MVWEIPKNGFDSRLSVQNVGGLPLRHEEERGGSIVLDFMPETCKNDVWTPVLVASYWL